VFFTLFLLTKIFSYIKSFVRRWIMNERIKELRKALGVTQQEFADKIGGKRNTVANYELGRSEPSAAVLSAICREFNVSEEWLRTGEGEMFKPNAMLEVDELVRRKGLSGRAKAFLTAFVTLPDDDQEIVMRYCEEVAEMLKKERESREVPAAGAGGPAADAPGPSGIASDPAAGGPAAGGVLSFDENIPLEKAEAIYEESLYKRGSSNARGTGGSALNTTGEKKA
jgi:transcriptional regulator with XRE-family HTH domain